MAAHAFCSWHQCGELFPSSFYCDLISVQDRINTGWLLLRSRCQCTAGTPVMSHMEQPDRVLSLVKTCRLAHYSLPVWLDSAAWLALPPVSWCPENGCVPWRETVLFAIVPEWTNRLYLFPLETVCLSLCHTDCTSAHRHGARSSGLAAAWLWESNEWPFSLRLCSVTWTPPPHWTVWRRSPPSGFPFDRHTLTDIKRDAKVMFSKKCSRADSAPQNKFVPLKLSGQSFPKVWLEICQEDDICTDGHPKYLKHWRVWYRKSR